MSKVKIQGNASGTGIFTVAAPATNTDRTITLPDVDATVLTTAGGNVAGELTLSHADEVGLKFKSTGTDGVTAAKILFEDTAGGIGGILRFDHDDNSFKFSTAGDIERMKIDSSGRVTKPYQPIFHVSQRTSNSSGIILSFAVTHINVGGHFNGTRFTCPIAGKYRFSWASLFGNSATVGRFHLYKNGSYAYGENSGDGVQLRIDNSDGHGYPYGERTVIISGSVGDYFEVRFASDNGANNDSSAGYTTFSGELIA
jgi:C1q domain